MIFDKQINAIEFFKKNKDAIILQIIKEIESDIVKYNKSQLYDFGERADGTKLPPYSQKTKRIKFAKGQRIDHMTLKDTGDFYKGFKVEIGKKEFKFKSTDIKYDYLRGMYENEIFGLNEENKQDMIDNLIYPLLLEKVKTMIYESGSAVIA